MPHCRGAGNAAPVVPDQPAPHARSHSCQRTDEPGRVEGSGPDSPFVHRIAMRKILVTGESVALAQTVRSSLIKSLGSA